MRRLPRHLAAMTIALVLCVSATGWAQSVSPGPLSRDHKSLEGIDSCLRCHSRGEAISSANCLGCHKALAAQIQAGAGYHPKVKDKDSCAGCHPDHRGRDVPLVRWPGGAAKRFDHDAGTGFALSGKHKRLDCRGCHKPALHKAASVARLLTDEERPRTYLGLRDDCVSCHDDPHEPSLGTTCESCHDAERWTGAGQAKKFDHGKTRFPLKGGHAKVGCAKCHGGTDDAILNRKIPFAACTDCHADPHGGKMQVGARTACTACHDESEWKRSKFDTSQHLPRSFPLNGGHARPACTACHGEHLDRVIQTRCASCHRDPHAPSLGAACQTCHSTSSWTGGRPPQKGDFHARTAYPLLGKHRTVACARCHDPKTPARRRFRPIAHDKCVDCHADPHLGEASKPCEGCHDLDGFAPANFEARDHAATKFALGGAHRAVPCVRCHPAAPASPGFRRGVLACEACHADPHGGQFANRSGGCIACHSDAAWSPSRFSAAKHRETGFALTGKHAVACGRCHGAAPGKVARFAKLPRDCGACHDDRHLGQFADRTCESCHVGSRFKKARRFDHRESFALRGRHAAAPCVSCHPKTEVGGRKTEVYRLGKPRRTCVGCHAAAHGDPDSRRPDQRALATETATCSDCHDEASWSKVHSDRPFEHALTGAALVGGHQRAACATCHRPGRELTRMQACTSCHRDRHGGRLGDRCEPCHSPSSWAPDRTLVDHQKTRLPLLGAHAVQACDRCHQDRARGDFRGLDPECGSCHQHTVDERAPHPPHVGRAFAECGDCHSSLGWRPAHFNHDGFWPLTGKHKTTECSGCHTSQQTGFSAPRACVGCHAGDLAAASFRHDGFDANDCARCHSTSAWQPADFPEHDPLFPLRGHHDLPCDSCHTRPNMIEVFSCVDCHTHRRSRSDSQHREVGGYTFDSNECYRCHPRGRGD